MRTDLAFTLRALRRAPYYSATIIGVAAVTMTLATTVFAIVDGVLFRPLPYPDAERLVVIEPGFEAGDPRVPPTGLRFRYSVSQADLDNWRAAAPEVAFAAFNPARWADLGPGVNDNTAGMARVQREFFDVIGVRPLHGGFDESHFLQESKLSPVLVMHDVWQQRFGGTLDAIGRDVFMNEPAGVGVRIVGVMPRGFVFPSTLADIAFITPLVDDPKARSTPPPRSLYEIVARLPATMTPEQLRERLRPALERTAQQYPLGPRPDGWSEAGWRTQGPYDKVEVVPLETALAQQSGPMFLGVFAAVVVLLLIAGANISSLMTARAWERRRELDVRRALGATSSGIARLWTLEVVVLLVAGAALAAVAVSPVLTLIVDLLPEEIALLKPPQLDWRVAGFVALTIAGLCALISIAPVRRSLTAPVRAGQGGTSDRVRTPARFLVVGGQVAAAFVLTVLGACLVGSLLTVYATDLPIARRDVQVVEVRLQSDTTIDADERTMRADRILQRLNALPGVTGTSAVMAQLLRGGGWVAPFSPPAGVRRLRDLDAWGVMGDFFRVLDLKAIAGRRPTPSEIQSGAPVIVISERVAQAYWPGRSAIGETMLGPVRGVSGQQAHTVIGVVPDVRWFAWDVESPMIYGPYRTLSRASLLTIFVRVDEAAAPSIEQTLRAVVEADPRVRATTALPLDAMFRDSVSLRRFQSWLFGGFAAAALAVMGAGVLGLLAMSTARRTKEIGIRSALGATRRAVIGQLLREQIGAVAVGLALGGAIAGWAVQLVRAYVYQLSLSDPRIWGTAVALIVATAMAGAFVPAIRASRTDPLTALRAE